jgi:NAD(P)-dependent dehydrogenase (short-subunit alcohol dehydrogenase family)
MEHLEGKVAVITGGASGIGLAIARRLAAEKVRLALLDVEAGTLDEAAASLREAGAEVLAIRVDVSKPDEMAAAAARVRAELGLAQIIINNAGVGGGTGPMWTLSHADWDWTLAVNLWGVIHGIRLFLPPLIESGEEGHVVNTASMAGLIATPWLGPYTATKHAVVAISEVLAKDLELAGSKVGVSVLCPGFVKTRIMSSERNRPAEQGGRAAGDAPAGPTLAAAMHQLVDNGKPVEEIVDPIIAAIRERRFYILTHPEMKPAIEHRLRDILEERPPGIDPMFRQLLGGR